MKGLGSNMRDFLRKIKEEPGAWTAIRLAEEFKVRASSVRRTLRTLEDKGLLRSEAGPHPERGGRPTLLWYPVDSTPEV